MDSSPLQIGLVPVSVLISALLGSGHCLGMCGPIVTVVINRPLSAYFYHLGRLISYLLLTILVTKLGSFLFAFFPHSLAAIIAPLTLGLSFLIIGFMLFNRRHFQLKLPYVMTRPFQYFLKKDKSPLTALWVGFFSISLPCGWLYGYVIGAGATQDMIQACTIIFMFWLGTIPSLVLTPWLMRKIIGPLKNKFPMLSALILCFLGLFIIISSLIRIW
jgi:sulfite exporter TauE/SafE